MSRFRFALPFLAAAIWSAVATHPAFGQANSGFRASVNYTGDLGPVRSGRPLCLCIYGDADVRVLLTCYISDNNDVDFPVVTRTTLDYYVVAFLDITINERLDPGEPYEIYHDRRGAPADPVAAAPGLTDIEITFGDEFLSDPTETPASSPTPSPTVTPSPTIEQSPTVTFTRAPSPTPRECTGDCDGSGEVQIQELVTLVNIALDTVELERCAVADTNGTEQIEINELVSAVNDALYGCRPASPGD